LNNKNGERKDLSRMRTTLTADALACLDQDRWSLEDLTAEASRITEERFSTQVGPTLKRRMLLYAPLYVSSYCENQCTYCGFRGPESIQRTHLSVEQALEQSQFLHQDGFRHILLVAGDFPKLTTPEYFAAIGLALREQGDVPAIEIAPQSVDGYRTIVEAGIRAVTLYQETYDRSLYAEYHPRGSKSSYDWRREALDRALETGMTRLGMGILLGLADHGRDLESLLQHAEELRAKAPEATLAFSLPRIHRAAPGFQVRYPVNDETFIRMYCALRIAFPEAELVLSTRESVALRSQLSKICITQLSAGSCTTPGGYGKSEDDRTYGQQFPVTDERSGQEVAEWLESDGFDVQWTS
jgi:2-iminoacetate synthase